MCCQLHHTPAEPDTHEHPRLSTRFVRYETCAALLEDVQRDNCQGQVYATLEASAADSATSGSWLGGGSTVQAAAPRASSSSSKTSSSAPSTPSSDGGSIGTNNQVAGVDEADIVKTNGEYLYTLSRHSWNTPQLVATRLQPSSNPIVLDRMDLTGRVSAVHDLLLNGDTVLIIGRTYTTITVGGSSPASAPPGTGPDVVALSPDTVGTTSPPPHPTTEGADADADVPADYDDMPEFRKGVEAVTMLLVDVSDKTNLRIVRRVDMEGTYVSARTINGVAHVVTSSQSQVLRAMPLSASTTSTTSSNSEEEASSSKTTSQKHVAPGAVLPFVRDITSPSAAAAIQTGPGVYSSITGRVHTPHGSAGARSSTQFAPVTSCNQVYHATAVNDPDSFVTVVSLPLQVADGAAVGQVRTSVAAGRGSTVYASHSAIYVSTTAYNLAEHRYDTGVMEFLVPPPVTTTSATTDDSPAPLVFAGGFVAPGTVLNQFSMDEHEGNFRIATTSSSSVRPASGIINDQQQQQLRRRGPYNHVTIFGIERQMGVDFVGDDSGSARDGVRVAGTSRTMVGQLLGLAPGETIRAARFLGPRAYLVTFRTTDPLFTLDLAVPEAPRVLGELKLPGYSEYLHPVNATHLLGIGTDTLVSVSQSGWERVVTTGVKLSLFDVTHVTKPREVYSLVLGDRGSSSEATRDHKAFLYDDAQKMLVLPISLALLTPQQRRVLDSNPWQSGNVLFQGAYVYQLAPHGFKLAATVTHHTATTASANTNNRRNTFDRYRAIRRNIVLPSDSSGNEVGLDSDGLPPLDGTLLTMSDSMLLTVELSSLHALSAVELVSEEASA